MGWGLAKSLLGSTSPCSFNAPTLKVRSSLRPVAVLNRRSYRPNLASGAICRVALTWLSSIFSNLVALIPGW